VDLHDEGRVLADGPLVVGQVGAVGGPHFAQDGAASLHHLGDAELAADLDQLAPRDDGLPAPGKAAQDEQDCGGVVVYDQGVLGPRQLAEDLPNVVIAEPAPACGQVELQVGVAPAHLDDALQGLPAQGRPAEIRVEDDPRRVDHAPQAVRAEPLDPGRDGFCGGFACEGPVLGPGAGEDGGADFVDDLPDRLEDLPTGRSCKGPALLENGKNLVDLREALQPGFLLIVHGRPHSSVHVWLRNDESIIALRPAQESLFLRAVQTCSDVRHPSDRG